MAKIPKFPRGVSCDTIGAEDSDRSETGPQHDGDKFVGIVASERSWNKEWEVAGLSGHFTSVWIVREMLQKP